MKEVFLFIVSIFTIFLGSAQLLNNECYILNNLDVSSNCYAIGISNNGIMNPDGQIGVSNSRLTPEGLVVTGPSTITEGAIPQYYSMPIIVGEGFETSCSSIFSEFDDEGLDMSCNSKVTITAQAGALNDTLEFFLGGVGRFYPKTSTHNTGSGDFILASYGFAEANTEYSFTFDFSELDPIIWAAWDAKTTIQSYGFRSATASSTFIIKKIVFGQCVRVYGYDCATDLSSTAKEASFEVFPNPANGDVVNFSKELNNISVMNTLGNVVFEANSAKELNVTSLENGVYILKSDEGSTKIIVE